MKYNLLIFFSFFSLLICVEYMEVPFELNYFNQSESKLYELMKKVFIDVESSIGQKQEKFKLALDQESISIAVPDINLKNPSGNFKKFDISSSDTFQMTHNFSQIILYDERFSKGIEGNDSFKLGENKVSIINFTVANEYKFMAVEEQRKINNLPPNCPHCSAPTSGKIVCEYCKAKVVE